MKKVLWLTSWYPNKLEPLTGDFIERHAKAASLRNHITVIHVVKDHLDVTPGASSVVNVAYPGFTHLTAYNAYYKVRRGFFSGALSLWKYFRVLTSLVKKYIDENGRPDLVQVHVCYKAGLGALYCKWKFGIKYVVSEHWTVFCPEAKPSLKDQSPLARWLMKIIYRNAEHSTAVSGYLARSLAAHFKIEEPVRIPNVVDSRIFFPGNDKHGKFTFIHISVLNYQKNPGHIIEAVSLLKERGYVNFRLIIYGPQLERVRQMIAAKKLEDYIDYRAEVTQDVLAAEVRRCHALILYSRFETFGCVVIEALASGLPVLVSDIPVMHEIVEERVTGSFVKPEQPALLAEKMLWMMENYPRFNADDIARKTQQAYSFEKVSEMFDDVFTRTSSPKQAHSRQG